jgi:membrane protease YdiL (CAAX protease family)
VTIADEVKSREGTLCGVQLFRQSLKIAIVGKPPYYGLGGVFLLCLLMGVVYLMSLNLHETFLGSSAHKYWYYDSLFAALVVACIVFRQRPELLSLSRWRPKSTDFVIGIPAGVLVPLALWLPLQDPIHAMRLSIPPRSSLIAIVVLGPMLEEIVCRATF